MELRKLSGSHPFGTGRLGSYLPARWATWRDGDGKITFCGSLWLEIYISQSLDLEFLGATQLHVAKTQYFI